MTDFFFKTSELSVGYNGKSLISNIEIRLNRGEILTLIGPNGAGKSTILKSITRHIEKLYGTVLIENTATETMSANALAQKVSVVLTDKPKTELLTSEDVVASGRYPYTGRLGILSEQDKAIVTEAMSLVNALSLRNTDFAQLSDGQRQRILLARAICQEPEIIVLDEPTSFLDLRYELELLSILRCLAKDRGIAVIMSLHNLAMAQKVSDYVMCVRGETIAHYGTPQEIFKRELISGLYDLDNGSYNPLFGSVEMAKPEGEAKAFVIAGGGTGIGIYRKLQKEGTPFFSGILHENDIDFQVASDLAAEVVAEKSFCEISDASYNRALKLIEKCDVVINCLSQYGIANKRNADLFAQAKKMGKKIAAM